MFHRARSRARGLSARARRGVPSRASAVGVASGGASSVEPALEPVGSGTAARPKAVGSRLRPPAQQLLNSPRPHAAQAYIRCTGDRRGEHSAPQRSLRDRLGTDVFCLALLPRAWLSDNRKTGPCDAVRSLPRAPRPDSGTLSRLRGGENRDRAPGRGVSVVFSHFRLFSREFTGVSGLMFLPGSARRGGSVVSRAPAAPTAVRSRRGSFPSPGLRSRTDHGWLLGGFSFGPARPGAGAFSRTSGEKVERAAHS